MPPKLSINDHNREAAGLRYVYPVLSRRAGGLSIGVNFNTNNACNWRCIYCQVPDLSIGSAPPIDLEQLGGELEFFLHDVRQGDFFERFAVPKEQRVIRDISLSGNGEPTSAKEFPEAVSLVGTIFRAFDLPVQTNYVLITNGSFMHQRHVQCGLQILREHSGVVWFKLDCGTRQGMKVINKSGISRQKHLDNLKLSAELCPTWLQTCVFNYHGEDLFVKEQQGYLDELRQLSDQINLQGVLLYTVARPSEQPEGRAIAKVSEARLQQLADQIRALGYSVKISC